MDSPAARRNLERKSRNADFDAVRPALEGMDARREGVMDQVDTYYHCREGRLKLRRIDGNHAELIWYARPDDEGVRASTYRRVAVPDAAALHAALSNALGVRGEVRKRREVWHWHNVRVHLDEVEGLGRYVEFEAVIDDASDEAISLERLEAIGRALGLESANDVAGSYADFAPVRQAF
jgi:adenylate cyclase, class 2